jgi:N utilization substance protein A
MAKETFDENELLRNLAKEKELTFEEVVKAYEDAITLSVRKQFDDIREKKLEIEITYNEKKRTREVFLVYICVEEYSPNYEYNHQQMLITDAKKHSRSAHIGDLVKIPFDLKDLSINASKTLKDKFRENLNNTQKVVVYNYFSSKVNELIKAKIIGIEEDYQVILDKEQISHLKKSDLAVNDSFIISDSTYVLLKKVDDKRRFGLDFEITRRDDKVNYKFIEKLIELEVPEVKEGQVSIMCVGKDPQKNGYKIGVKSNAAGMDPVSACVGKRDGTRSKKISEYLNGERIDFFEYSDNAKNLIQNSLRPADVINVIIGPQALSAKRLLIEKRGKEQSSLQEKDNDKIAIVIVKKEELSKAIGKNGINVLLAHLATNFNIDVITEDDANSLAIVY